MRITNLSLVFIFTVMLLLLLVNSFGPKVTQPSLLITNPVGLYPPSEDPTVHSAGSGDDPATGDTSMAGGSLDSQCLAFDDDSLSMNGQKMFGGDHPTLSVAPNLGEWLPDYRTSCAMIVEPVKASLVFDTIPTGHVIPGFWAGLIAIFGVVTNRQSERSSTSSLGFRKSRPRLSTDTVSLRIDSILRENLEEEAKKNRTSLNTLVSQILFRYTDWWRYAGRLGLIPVSKDLLRDVFKSLDKAELEELGKRFAETSGREHVLYLFQQLSLGTVLQFLDLWSSHFDAYEHRYNGRMHFYTVHHDVNLNFSIFVKEFVSTMIMGTVPRMVRFEIVAPNSVTFSFEG